MISDKKFERHALYFSVGFILKETENDIPYQLVLAKLGHILWQLEIEIEMLFNINTKKYVEMIIEQVYLQLNKSKECIISLPSPIDYVIHLKLLPSLSTINEIKSSLVPYPIKYPFTFNNNALDLTFNKIIPYINGINSIKKIAIQSR